ncbi:unnamed protein product [Boreogadus saida]
MKTVNVVSMVRLLLLIIALVPGSHTECPDKESGLQAWNPGHSEDHHVTIGYGRSVLLMDSATVHSIEILDGGKLVIADTSRPILLRTKHILIGNKGEMHVGSPECPYTGNFTISLFGRSDDQDDAEHNYFGRKYVGVGTGGTLEIHGQKKLSWTFLNKTLVPGESNQNSYLFQRGWGNRGIIVHVIDPKTGEVLRNDRFDTYRSKDESRRLAQYVEAVEPGLLLAMVVNDEGSNNLEDTAKKSLSKLGSQHAPRLGFRHPWSFIVVKGDVSSALEDHAVYQGTKASSEARSSRVLQSMYGEHFSVTISSQWVQEAEWTEWFDRDDERGSGDWEKLSELHKTFPDRLCSSPLDIQAETHDGVPSNQTGDVLHRVDKEYGLVCLNKDQTHGLCHNYRDGPEERNTFDHCLGLMVRAGTLLPSDRDSTMCRNITSGAFPGYVANPRQDCSATSTFWIANPNNNLINCAAAGSEETGFWYLFHHVPTGPSEGMYFPGRTEHTPMGQFTNNRAHSNYRAGMILDNGVKTTKANDKDKRPYLSLVGARYGPHEDADPFKPRVPALIHHFVAYKNQDHGAWLRGGDVWLDECQFADNGIGLTLASGGTFPDDDGSRQEVKNTLFVGESDNHGTAQPDNRVWGTGGADLSGRTMPRGLDFPIRGMQIYDGPIKVQNCTFRKYVAVEGRHTSAFGFRLNNSWQSCPNNNVTDITFDNVPITSRVFFGEPGPWFSKMQMDGDKTTIFHDVDGSVSEYPGAFLVKDDNWLLRHPDCIDVPDWRAAICSGHYAQIYIQTRNPANLNMLMVKNEYPDRPLALEGALGKRKHYQQFQPVVTLAKGYTVHWDQPAPAEVTVWLINFNRNDWINVGFCYPQGTTFTILADIHNRLSKETRKTGVFLRTMQRDKVNHSHLSRGYYYLEPDTGLLFIKVKAHNGRESFAFCSVKGCERVKITAVIPKGSPPSNCMARAYPRHAEQPIVDVPMPRKLPNARLHSPEHFLEIKMESYNTRFFHLKEDFAYTEVNGRKLYQPEDGVMLTIVDGHDGKLVETKSFRNTILQGIPTQLDSYISGLADGSVVIVTSKGRLVTRGAWTKALERLGVDKSLKLKDKLVLVGFKGPFRPEWVHVEVGEDRVKIHQVLPIPVVQKTKL